MLVAGGTVDLVNVTFSSNAAIGGVEGGAIYNLATLSLTKCTFSSGAGRAGPERRLRGIGGGGSGASCGVGADGTVGGGAPGGRAAPVARGRPAGPVAPAAWAASRREGRSPTPGA
jgi:hypothetical protein